MAITYKKMKEYSKENLVELFSSVEWESANYPEKLVKAISNYNSVYSAWDEDKLVGLISTMDDGVMTAYVHYLLVNPEYQGYGIGKKLVEMTKEYYKDYLSIVLVSYKHGLEFYKRCGFTLDEDKYSMSYSTME